MNNQNSNAADVMPWHQNIRGTQVLPIIDLDSDIIRVEAGPGTGKTFGLVRRVQRILHPLGLNVPGDKVLVVAFNRVIAQQLRLDIKKCLENSEHNGEPIIETVHALCLKVIGNNLRILLPHEVEAMIYDVLDEYTVVRQKYSNFKKTEQALRDHEAKDKIDIQLWQAVQRWLIRHNAQLISELPSLLLAKVQGGDLSENTYSHVIVDEFQDLTPGEQSLFIKLKAEVGKFVALGDPRQSIYRFRGNEKEGLSKIEELLDPSHAPISNVAMTECQRCPKEIVQAANQLMSLYSSEAMTPGNQESANWHLVVWKSLESEAKGMAERIVENIRAHPREKGKITHLAMVTRRQFGYQLREEIAMLDTAIKVDLSFSESLLESWAVREAFLYFCLLVDPDAPTWRAWLGYQNSFDGKKYLAPKRNANAYLKFLTGCNDVISEAEVNNIANSKTNPPGLGGGRVLERAQRLMELRKQLQWKGEGASSLLQEVFDVNKWASEQSFDFETAKLDMELLLNKALGLCDELQMGDPGNDAEEILTKVARTLRYQIATREPFLPEESSDLHIATLWGSKGITAEHVYLIGLCKQAIPGNRHPEYQGTELEYFEEQKRLFYVSITRSRKTLVMSRANSIGRGQAKKLGLEIKPGKGYRAKLEMSPFLQDIIQYLPNYQKGESWHGCL